MPYYLGDSQHIRWQSAQPPSDILTSMHKHKLGAVRNVAGRRANQLGVFAISHFEYDSGIRIESSLSITIPPAEWIFFSHSIVPSDIAPLGRQKTPLPLGLSIFPHIIGWLQYGHIVNVLIIINSYNEEWEARSADLASFLYILCQLPSTTRPISTCQRQSTINILQGLSPS